MPSVLPVDGIVVDELRVCLVDELRRAEGMVLALLPKLLASDVAQLVVDRGEHIVERASIAISGTGKQGSDIPRGVLRGHNGAAV